MTNEKFTFSDPEVEALYQASRKRRFDRSNLAAWGVLVTVVTLAVIFPRVRIAMIYLVWAGAVVTLPVYAVRAYGRPGRLWPIVALVTAIGLFVAWIMFGFPYALFGIETYTPGE